MNPLLRENTTSLQAVAFDQIKNKHYLPAFEELIEKNDKEIQQIVENPESPNFQNVIEAMAYSGMDLERVSQIFFNLNSAETNDDMQNIAQKISSLLTDFSSKIFQNEVLFKKIEHVYRQKETYKLSTEQKILLEETYKGFVRNGALLNSKEKEELRAVDIDLSLKMLQFGQNVLSATNGYQKYIVDREELRGVPEDIVLQYEEAAREKGKDGFLITLQSPSYIPMMTYAENRALRKELFLANGKKAFDGGEYDNQNLIKEILKLRKRKAELLGYANYADFVLEERMAESYHKVILFLEELLSKAESYSKRELAELQELADKDEVNDIQAYDHAFYVEKLRKKKFDIDEEELKPYFELNKVQAAVFELAGRLFGLSFSEREDIPKYHQEVKVYEVHENGKYKALLYVDYHPREGKRSGAWMTSYKNQFKKGKENSRPHISIVCNFSKPTKQLPSLLTFQEVTTLFHEFGHALHGILADTVYPGLSGTSVKWDFVELPSQFLENYCYEADFLKSFARHYKTGKVLDDEKIKKISESRSFMEGYQTLRQIGFGLLDMAYHISSQEDVESIKQFEDTIFKKVSFYPVHDEIAVSTSFSHIFQGGYAVGYYSYKWAEVLDADAFAYFRENGIFNPEVANKFKILLSSGGAENPMKLYKNFRGQDPKVKYLLQRAFGNL